MPRRPALLRAFLLLSVEGGREGGGRDGEGGGEEKIYNLSDGQVCIETAGKKSK